MANQAPAKVELILSMRKQGMTYRAIGEALHMSGENVRQTLLRYAGDRTTKPRKYHMSGERANGKAFCFERLEQWRKAHEMSVYRVLHNAGVVPPNGGTYRFMIGKKYSVDLDDVKRLLNYTGLTFWEAFGDGTISRGEK